MANGIDYNRADWGAAAPAYEYARPTYPVTHVFIHHGAVLNGGGVSAEMSAVRSYQRFHMGPNRGWSDIAYGILVGLSGSSYEGRGWRRQGGATGSPQDSYSLSICAIGNFSEQEPSQDMLDRIVSTIVYGMRNGHIRRDAAILGHRDKPFSTSCPGDKLYSKLGWIRNEVERIMSGGAPGGGDVIPFEDWRTHYNSVDTYARADGIVAFVQDRLARLGFLAADGVDGVKGPATNEAVVAFELAHGHNGDASFGRPSWESLLSAEAPYPPALASHLASAAEHQEIAKGHVMAARFIVNAVAD